MTSVTADFNKLHADHCLGMAKEPRYEHAVHGLDGSFMKQQNEELVSNVEVQVMCEQSVQKKTSGVLCFAEGNSSVRDDIHAESSSQMHCSESCFNTNSTFGFLSEDHRNLIYDSWFDSCQVWERKRLVWLCNIARLNGCEESAIIQTTFLGPSSLSEDSDNLAAGIIDDLKCNVAYTETFFNLDGDDTNEPISTFVEYFAKEYESDHQNSEDILCLKSDNEPSHSGSQASGGSIDNYYIPTDQINLSLSSSSKSDLDVWEEWYRIERLNRHRGLMKDGCPNWYNELLCEEKERCAQGLSIYSTLYEAIIEHDKLTRQLYPEISYCCNFDWEGELSVDEMYLYQLTDPYFWFNGCKNYF